MLETLFRGLFDSDLTSVIGVTDFLLCMGFSLVIGIVMALSYMYRTRDIRRALLLRLLCFLRWSA